MRYKMRQRRPKRIRGKMRGLTPEIPLQGGEVVDRMGGEIPLRGDELDYRPRGAGGGRVKYNILGGVIAPAESTYSMPNMKSPLMFTAKTKKPIDRRLPSMRFRGAVANLDNFNPYTKGVKRVNYEPQREVYKKSMSDRRYTTNVQLHGKPAMSPVLSRNKTIW